MKKKKYTKQKEDSKDFFGASQEFTFRAKDKQQNPKAHVHSTK